MRCVYKRMSLGHFGISSLHKVEEIMVPGFDNELYRRWMNLLGHFEHTHTHTHTHIHAYRQEHTFTVI